MSEKDPKTVSLTIKCLKCGAKFPSPIVMSPKSAFDSSALENNFVQCKSCGEMTKCTKENFVARFEDGETIGNEAISFEDDDESIDDDPI